MDHLISETVHRIEDNLIFVKSVRDAVIAWWFNIVLLVVVLCSFSYFIFASYGKPAIEEVQDIPFEPRMWNNAVRNVPTIQYGQLPQTEIGGSIQGFTRRTSATTF